jgi:uncharacterized membrane protein
MMDFKDIISVAGYGIEAVGVLVIISGSVAASLRFLACYRKQAEGVAYRAYRRQLGRSIILGLEFLIAGDIIRTVVVADTLANVAVLGLIILIRSFLSVTLFLEVEGRWPWQQTEERQGGSRDVV